MIRGILSDLDGVLVDSSVPHERIWTAWARRHDLDPERIVHEVHGQPSLDAVRKVAPHLDARAESAAVERAQVEDTAGVVALPGAAELLRGALPLPVAVVTSCTVGLAHARLRAAGLPVPAAMVTAERVMRGKPDPAGYLLGAALLGLAPAECLVVEDAPAGVAAGRAAGMTVVAVATTHAWAELAAADGLLTDLTRLAAWL